MSTDQILAERFEAQRARLQAVAYRMLGSLAEAEDAVQETWVRLSSSDPTEIENLAGWLTTVVGRICLNVLRSRRTHRQDALAVYVPDPIIDREGEADPEHEALIADSVGLALMVVLETLQPAERVAFVLHDMFDVPFDEIASIAGRTPVAVRQLASRARRRVQDGAPRPDVDLVSQRKVVNAFFAAAHDGDFDALVAVLDPNVVIRADGGPGRASVTAIVNGAAAVASQAVMYSRLSPFLRPALVNGVAGVVVVPKGEPFAVMAFTVRGDRVVAIDALGDPVRLRQLVDMSLFGD
jgi:RNA polymerase sigma factor (sigma-70 family)